MKFDFFLTYCDYGMFVGVRNFWTVYIYSTKKSSDFVNAIFYDKKILLYFIDMFYSVDICDVFDCNIL